MIMTRSLLMGFMLLAVNSTPAFAETLNVPEAPAKGTNTVATADLLVSRPTTTPCVVTLFDGQTFEDFSAKPLTYSPPADCPAPWSKVVLEADYGVTAGRQYDRTAIINLDGVNIYFGTTMEPSSSVARSWHVERDLTDYSDLFKKDQSGEAILDNLVNDTYTGILSGTAKLYFYPKDSSEKNGRLPQRVLPLAAGVTSLSPDNPTLSKTFSLPRNVDKAYLDIMAEAQSSDEFWYTCVPDEYEDELESCGGTSFREVEIQIDGTPAGVAPVHPWIYTGGIDPYLWFPTPGAQTLNFEPYRVDLTPFAAELSDGNDHTITLQVYNGQSYFNVMATLLVYRDAGTDQITGALVSNNLAAEPTVNIDNELVEDSDSTTGTLTVSSTRKHTISGYVITSSGRVDTTVTEKIKFSNAMNFDIDSKTYGQYISQDTTIKRTTTSTDSDGTTTVVASTQWPLTLNILQQVDGVKLDWTTDVDMSSNETVETTKPSGKVLTTVTKNRVAPSDTLILSLATGSVTSHPDNSSFQVYQYQSEDGNCYKRRINVASNAVSKVKTACDE